MNALLDRPSVSVVRWVGRILGTLLGLLVLFGFIEGVTGPTPPTAIRDYLIAVGCVLVALGFAVAWFKELAAFFLVLGGSALVLVVRLLLPRGERVLLWIFLAAAILSFLFLYIHLATRKR